MLATGYGAERAGRAGVAAAVALATVGLAMCVAVAVDDRHQRDDWRGVAERVGTADAPRMLVISPSTAGSRSSYLPGATRRRAAPAWRFRRST